MSELPKLSDFPSQTYDKLRFGDTDKLGHVNNAVFVTLLETGRTSLLQEAAGAAYHADCYFVIAKLTLDYRAEIFWPGTVEIGTAVTQIGNTSISFAQALFQNEKCTATATSTLVLINAKTQKPTPITGTIRERFEALRK
jgi:acyl-CoA thioester hydrolase